MIFNIILIFYILIRHKIIEKNQGCLQRDICINIFTPFLLLKHLEITFVRWYPLQFTDHQFNIGPTKLLNTY